MKLTFKNDTDVDLGIDQSSIYDDHERTRADAFMDAIRRHMGL
ncbi:hypothetical protein [Mycolicibacterium neoaurum]|nr:hypothetical protein [Mycolicibacterium neoaurum]